MERAAAADCPARIGVARARLSLLFVLASAFAYLAQALAIFGWDEAFVACASVALPIGLAYVVPRIRFGRGKRDGVVAEWDRRVAWLFVPWLAAVLLLWSSRALAYVAHWMSGAVFWHFVAYLLLVIAAGAEFFVAFLRAPSLRHEGMLAFLATAILAVTAIGGFGLLAILGLAVT